MVNVLQHMAEWLLVVIWQQRLQIYQRCCGFPASLQAVDQSLGSKLSDIRGILSMIHDLLMSRYLLEGPRLLKLIPAKSTILQNR